MKTRHSIDLKKVNEPCFARTRMGYCRVLIIPARECGYKCKFYKPEGCQDWVRVEDWEGLNLVPPEEYRRTI